MANTIDTLAAAVVSAEINATKDNVHAGSILKGWDKDVRRFMMMLFLTGSFMVVELVAGIITGSVALQADAFHMLSDVISLAVGFYAVKATKSSASVTATYGLVRYEIVGALVNGVFLLATCLGIIIEVIQRFIAIEDAQQTVEDARVLMIVAGVGLAINVLGLIMFASGDGHGHSHGGGHGHSHGAAQRAPSKKNSHGHSHSSTSHGHSHGAPRLTASADVAHGHSHASGEHGHSHGAAAPSPSEVSHGHSHSNGSHGHSHGASTCGSPQPTIEADHGHSHDLVASDEHAHSHGGDPPKKKMSMNVRGVLLHVLGDALGSIAVLISGAIMEFTTWPNRQFADPLASLIIVLIIMSGSLPLVRHSTHILLQKVPFHIDVADLKEKVLQLDGILSVHDFHVWQLDSERVVGSLHVMIDRRVKDYRKLQDAVKAILHEAGIHASTIQPEYLRPEIQSKLEAVERASTPQLAASDSSIIPTSGVAGAGVTHADGRPASPGNTPRTYFSGTFFDKMITNANIDGCDDIVCGDSCVTASCCPPPPPQVDTGVSRTSKSANSPANATP